jgi:hypothetical protein
MAYLVKIERASLSIEQGTPNVPADGRYYVIHQGQIMGKYKSLKQAEKLYKTILTKLNLPPLTGSTGEEQKANQLKQNAYEAVDKMAFETFAKAKQRSMKRGKTRTFG